MATLQSELSFLNRYPQYLQMIIKDGIIILNLIQLVEHKQQELNKLIELLLTGSYSSLDTSGELYQLMHKIATTTSKAKYYPVIEEQECYLLKNALITFNKELERLTK